MKQEESSPEIKDFINGLKIAIRNSFPTQEEFAKGVTSRVKMSNLLRGKVGTSQSMRQALAARAGKSVDEIIALGRQVSQGADIVLTTPGETPIKDEPYEPKYAGKSTAKLLNATTGLTVKLQSEISDYNKEIVNIINDVADERDRLVKILAQETAITNAMTSAIEVVDRDMKITSVNRTMMEQFMIFPGDLVGNNNCPFCSEIEGIVNKVFNREGVIRKLITHDHDCYAITACPIIDPTSWAVTQVVVSITPASPWLDLLKEAGWMPPIAQARKNT